MSENSRTIEITEHESRALGNAMRAFMSVFRANMMDMEAAQATDLLDQTTTIRMFLDKVQYAFKHKKPCRKATLYAIDGKEY